MTNSMNVKCILTLMITLLWNLVLAVSGNGNVTSERKTVNSFNILTVTGPFKIIFSNNPHSDFFIKVTTDKNLQQYVTVNQIGLSVFINIKPGIDIEKFTQMQLDVDNNDMHSLTINANSFEESEGPINSCEELHLKISGSIPTNFEVKTERLLAEINNLRTTRLSGEIKETVIINNNSGQISAFNLKSDYVRIKNNGNGPVETFGAKQFEISSQGMGFVYYKGGGVLTKRSQFILGSVCEEQEESSPSPSTLSKDKQVARNNKTIGFNTDSLFQRMMERDQKHRKTKYPTTINTEKEDAENFSCLKWYLNKYGYPEIETDSLRLIFTTLFMHIDNYDNFLQIKDFLLGAVKSQKLQPNVYAYSYDRSLLASKKDPIFYYFPPGSDLEIQHKPAKKELQNVNKAREDIGLPTYPNLFNGKYF